MKHLLGAVMALSFTATTPALASICDASNTVEPIPPIDADQALTLNRVLLNIRHASPQARAAALEVQARLSDADQAGRRLNPVLSMEVEEFGGSGGRRGFNGAETTLAVEQTLQLGRKRERAEAAARALTALASADCAVILREVELHAAILFYQYVFALEDAVLLEEASATAVELASTVRQRVQVGAAPPPEQIRAESEAASAQASAVHARGLADQSRYELASLWGNANPQFTSAQIGSLLLDVDHTTPHLIEHPRVIQAEAATEARRREIDVQRAAAVPNITLLAGVRRFEDNGDNALVAGISVPLPIFDRRRGATRAAELRADVARINRVAVETELRAGVRRSLSAVESAESRLELLETSALPRAIKAYEASVKGYSAGKFDLTTTFDARNALLGARRAVLNAHTNLRIETARLKSVTGAYPFSGE